MLPEAVHFARLPACKGAVVLVGQRGEDQIVTGRHRGEAEGIGLRSSST